MNEKYLLIPIAKLMILFYNEIKRYMSFVLAI